MTEIHSSSVDQHYGLGDVMSKIQAALNTLDKDMSRLSTEDLAPIDGFHTRGRTSTQEVTALANITSSDIVLDVGCGLGGTARYLAEQFNCQVVGIDLTREYVDVGRQLNTLLNMDSRVGLHHASALDLPFENNSFDYAWTEHVQMNIADKQRFYSEIVRVLKPGGRLMFHDVFRGEGDEPYYPVPWAEQSSISSLVTQETAKSIFAAVGLTIEKWLDKTQESIDFFEVVSEKLSNTEMPPLGIHLLMGDTAKLKLENQARNLKEQRVTIALGVANKI